MLSASELLKSGCGQSLGAEYHDPLYVDVDWVVRDSRQKRANVLALVQTVGDDAGASESPAAQRSMPFVTKSPAPGRRLRNTCEFPIRIPFEMDKRKRRTGCAILRWPALTKLLERIVRKGSDG